MSLVKRQIGKKRYWYLKLPGPREIYLGPEEDLDASRLHEAIEYVLPRFEHYSEILYELMAKLPEEDRRRLSQVLPRETPKSESHAIIEPSIPFMRAFGSTPVERLREALTSKKAKKRRGTTRSQ